jgi:hypothetical protein
MQAEHHALEVSWARHAEDSTVCCFLFFISFELQRFSSLSLPLRRALGRRPRIPCRYVVFSSSLSCNNSNLSPPLRRKLISLICSANKNRHLSLSPIQASLFPVEATAGTSASPIPLPAYTTPPQTEKQKKQQQQKKKKQKQKKNKSFSLKVPICMLDCCRFSFIGIKLL